MTKSDKTEPTEAEMHLHLFRKSLPLRMKLHEIRRALGRTDGQTCLDIGMDNGIMSHHLRKGGGNWHSAVTRESVRASVQTIVGKNVHVLNGPTLPFEEGYFDAVVIVDFLKYVESDYAFIEECHRIMKSEGRLVVSVSRLKPWTLIKPLRKILGLSLEKEGQNVSGYSESGLFRILKHGFDVLNVYTYSRFFVEFVDAFITFFARRMTMEENREKGMRLYSIAGPLYWIADQLDMCLFLTKGHRFVSSAKRRVWRPRKTPLLADGRSISEAVLSRLES